ncbi:MAG: threonylcarbamoyl-AMP synthase [Spirochaetaceae bacterium]|jgi:L-threonylcarbamoyladenylate synthase|nr:threonylcarbamoyl-AMP synthase [Spirochaetaceae bacterium]
MMRLLSVSDADIAEAAEALKAGLLVAFPTETVYGLGADGFNPAALARVFAAKNRPRFDPLIIHIAQVEGLEAAADLALLSGKARQQTRILCGSLWPGPLTLILPKQREVPDLATSGLPTVAVRLPDHPAARKLISLSTGAVAAPSANPFGFLSPTTAEHVRDQLGEKVDLIIDGGRTRVGVESTVLDMTGPRPRILRPGGVPREQIEALIGPVALPAAHEAGPVNAPGQLKSHYAPRTPLSLHSPPEMAALTGEAGAGYLFFRGESRDRWLAGKGETGPSPRIRSLSGEGDTAEAAAALFETLHELDRLGLSRIHAEEAPLVGLGPAINDRLRRAAAL